MLFLICNRKIAFSLNISKSKLNNLIPSDNLCFVRRNKIYKCDKFRSLKPKAKSLWSLGAEVQKLVNVLVGLAQFFFRIAFL